MAKFTTDTRYLGHADISETEDTIVTITSYSQEMMGQGKDAQEKWVLGFREIKKGLGLNKTNGKMLCKLFNTDDMDAWVGHKIALYVKDDVEYQGEIMSAIRVRHKLPGSIASPVVEDLSTLSIEEVIYRIDHAHTLKEIGALVAHGQIVGTADTLKMMQQAKEQRITALMG